MKRNSIVAGVSLIGWLILVLIEVKVQDFSFLKIIYFGTFPFIVIGFVWANKNSFSSVQSRGLRLLYRAILILILFSILIGLGVVVGVNFKLMLGGSL